MKNIKSLVLAGTFLLFAPAVFSQTETVKPIKLRPSAQVAPRHRSAAKPAAEVKPTVAPAKRQNIKRYEKQPATIRKEEKM